MEAEPTLESGTLSILERLAWEWFLGLLSRLLSMGRCDLDRLPIFFDLELLPPMSGDIDRCTRLEEDEEVADINDVEGMVSVLVKRSSSSSELSSVSS